MVNLDAIWAKYDTNDDGQLTREEAGRFFDEYYMAAENSTISESAKNQLFNLIDKSSNRNGIISKNELRSKMKLLFPNIQ